MKNQEFARFIERVRKARVLLKNQPRMRCVYQEGSLRAINDLSNKVTKVPQFGNERGLALARQILDTLIALGVSIIPWRITKIVRLLVARTQACELLRRHKGWVLVDPGDAKVGGDQYLIMTEKHCADVHRRVGKVMDPKRIQWPEPPADAALSLDDSEGDEEDEAANEVAENVECVA